MNIRIKGKKNDPNRIRAERVLITLDKVYRGEIADLECPYCSKRPLQFSYTNASPDAYGIWISCTFCGKAAHLKVTARPPGYDEQYVLKEFQKRDEQAAKATGEWWKWVSGEK